MHINEEPNDASKSMDLHFSKEKFNFQFNSEEQTKNHDNIVFHQELQKALEQLDLSWSTDVYANYKMACLIKSKWCWNFQIMTWSLMSRKRKFHPLT